MGGTEVAAADLPRGLPDHGPLQRKPRSARGIRRGLPGGILAAFCWLTASALFALYATQVGSYSRLYGSLAGLVVFLIWVWFANLSLLAGAQFNVELRRPEPEADAHGGEPVTAAERS